MEQTNNTSSTPTTVGSVSCPACKTDLESSAKFCPNCGSATKKDESVKTTPTPPQPPSSLPLVPVQKTSEKTMTFSELKKPEKCTCGQILPDNARFCHQCGKPLKQAPFSLICSGKPPKTFELHDEEILIGKSEDCNISLAEDEFVSRQHARIAIKDGKPVLEDLNSSNGTYVKIQSPIQLQPGNEFLIGTHLFRLEKTD